MRGRLRPSAATSRKQRRNHCRRYHYGNKRRQPRLSFVIVLIIVLFDALLVALTIVYVIALIVALIFALILTYDIPFIFPLTTASVYILSHTIGHLA